MSDRVRGRASIKPIIALLIVFAVFRLGSWVRTGFSGNGSSTAAGESGSEVTLTVPDPKASRDGIAVAVLVDTSGSMKERVAGAGSERRPKIEIARSCLAKIVERMEGYAAEDPKRVFELSLYAFSGNDAALLSPLGPPNAAAAERLLRTLKPDGGTPIGDAVAKAHRDLARSGLNRRHVLVVTDGENTTGAAPGEVARAMAVLREDQRSAVYIVAFDVNAAVFNDVKANGWSVFPAANESELGSALDALVGERILLEK